VLDPAAQFLNLKPTRLPSSFHRLNKAMGSRRMLRLSLEHGEQLIARAVVQKGNKPASLNRAF